jgi:hypothetical protein
LTGIEPTIGLRQMRRTLLTLIPGIVNLDPGVSDEGLDGAEHDFSAPRIQWPA